MHHIKKQSVLKPGNAFDMRCGKIVDVCQRSPKFVSFAFWKNCSSALGMTPSLMRKQKQREAEVRR